jgi:hypothetical protein
MSGRARVRSAAGGDVAGVLERTRDRMTKYLRRRGLLDEGDTDADAAEGDASERAGLTRLAASAVSGATPPVAAGPFFTPGQIPGLDQLLSQDGG